MSHLPDPRCWVFLVFPFVCWGRGDYIMIYVYEVEEQHAGIGSLFFHIGLRDQTCCWAWWQALFPVESTRWPQIFSFSSHFQESTFFFPVMYHFILLNLICWHIIIGNISLWYPFSSQVMTLMFLFHSWFWILFWILLMWFFSLAFLVYLTKHWLIWLIFFKEAAWTFS